MNSIRFAVFILHAYLSFTVWSKIGQQVFISCFREFLCKFMG
ncbi:hypothetical protein MCHI_003619 [Candidatus Magnetoovum chiemensis]|nr:hypothetical protein MCHI_003619 [Candidatus Magnetoovum chiemensis]